MNLTPTPPATKMLHWKKKFYKGNIDNTFDVTSKVGVEASPPPSTGTPPPTTQTHRHTPSHKELVKNANSKGLIVSVILTSVGLLLSIGYLITTANFRLTLFVLIVAFVVDACAAIGRPRLDPSYAMQLSTHPAASPLLFAMACLPARSSVLVLLPSAAHAILLLSSVYTQRLDKPKILHISYFTHAFNTLENKREGIIQGVADFELFYCVLNFVLIFFGKGCGAIPLFILWSVMRVKYLMSGQTRSSFFRANRTIEGYLSAPFIPEMIRKIYRMISNFLYSQVDLEKQQRGGGIISSITNNCTIM
eukprot:GHVR01143293.1.p1 GENE.GHVR01143293.1~~GHVR01143293.1.p1  ORF type:complete len:306 (+),score=59.47 GHVR01143293.1:207-1124(+)